ncbi:MAG: glycosyltransferase family 2 protein [Ruminococcaceae bacterium]|nr:glycosyltransferase family 2 protein [Oscillospiraceae bacterium]
MKLQVLVATMHQTDHSVAEKMNIRCDAVIANQASDDKISEYDTEYGTLKMITTSTRGVGLNRNIALLASDADIVVFGDDDMCYNDDMAESVIKAFEELHNADVIIFGADMVKDSTVFEERRCKRGRLRLWNSMKFGTYRIAAKRNKLVDQNITFHQRFGGGCEFSAGEDSIFIKNCLDRGLKLYTHEYSLGTCCKDTSSWFVGYNEKYFYDKGVLVRTLFPKTAYLMALYFGINFKRETDIKVFDRLKLIYSGVRGGKKMIPYGDRK